MRDRNKKYNSPKARTSRFLFLMYDRETKEWSVDYVALEIQKTSMRMIILANYE